MSGSIGVRSSVRVSLSQHEAINCCGETMQEPLPRQFPLAA
ncbi:hypothetical protein BIW11_03005 [Tropilaelaps mercedesae]|uniref:Uncharacterized protein n=1 Tax=Tropilaelaps mercedesae TaxID=418985 RepID=A0A1V9XTM5_9ACAR|nr:hypothetical protein BIW11_03005 [Tropilaelaps mercedesae]